VSERRRVSFVVLAAVVAVVGCAGKKDTAEPPAKLVAFPQTLDTKKVWDTKVGKGSERLRLGLKPATDGARVFAAAHNGEVVALDAATGKKVWSIKSELPLSAGPGYADGLLVLGSSDGDLLALDAATGAEQWRQQVGSEILAAPAIYRGAILLRTVDGRLRGFAVNDGHTLWTVEENLPALTLRGNATPRIAGDLVVSGFNNGRVGAYSVANGDQAWEVAIANPTGRTELERLVDVSTGLQVVGNEVYVSGYHGRAVGIDGTTGVVLWQQEMSSFVGLGADFANVYVTTDVDAVIALDRQAGSQVWRQEALRLRDVTAPTRFRNAVVVGDYQGYLHWLDLKDGHFLAREHATGHRIGGAPLVIGDNVCVQDEDGEVAAYTVREEAPKAEATAKAEAPAQEEAPKKEKKPKKERAAKKEE
jgi:outer membrane protein assembly factor BamB